MALNRADVVLHPVRLRIVRSFRGSERRTAGELTRLLPDVPQASLYRHLGALVEGNILRVVRAGAGGPPTGDPSTGDDRSRDDWTGDDRLDGLPAGRQRGRVARRGYALAEPAMGGRHREVEVYLDDDEYDELTRALADLVDRATANRPRTGRRRRLLATAVIPLDDERAEP